MTEPAVTVDGVGHRYPDSQEDALCGITLSIERGERLGILGPNGGGKSTLIKIILGLIRPKSGTVLIDGEPPERARTDGLIGYVPQRSTAELRFPLGVRDVVRMPIIAGSGLFGRVPQEALDRAEQAMELVGITDLASRRIGALSGGQLQRALIARAVSCGPTLLLLDEPTVGIDISGQRQFAAMLSRLRDELDLTIVTVSHDVRTVGLSSDRVACLRRTLHYHDTPGGLSPEVLAELFSHDVAAVFGSEAHVHAHGPECVHDGASSDGDCGCAHD